MADRRPADWPDNTGQWKGQVKGGGEGQSVSIIRFYNRAARLRNYFPFILNVMLEKISKIQFIF